MLADRSNDVNRAKGCQPFRLIPCAYADAGQPEPLSPRGAARLHQLERLMMTNRPRVRPRAGAMEAVDMRSRVLSHAAALGCTCPGTVYVHVRVDVLGVPHVDIEHAAGCAASVAAATSVQS